jgi:hypothetical protein
MHLRLGDKHMDIDQKYLNGSSDSRVFDENQIFNFIKNNIEQNRIIFVCDNNAYKLKIKNKNDLIIISNCDISHSGLIIATEKQVLDCITEFYILTNSQHIYSFSSSGFSETAAKFKNIPITFMYKFYI